MAAYAMVVAALLAASLVWEAGSFVRRQAGLAGSSWPPPPPPAPVEVVVAHYSEPLDWLDHVRSELPPNAAVAVYTKGSEAVEGAERLPNVGREGHTFLHHLVKRYDDLANVTLFVMGSANATKMKRGMLQRLLSNWTAAIEHGLACPGHQGLHAPSPAFNISAWQGTTDDDWQPMQLASPRPLGPWFAKHVGGDWPCTWCVSSLLAVSRDRVRLRPRAFYEKLLAQLAVGRDPEVGHYLERTWVGIFRHPDPEQCMPPFVWRDSPAPGLGS